MMMIYSKVSWFRGVPGVTQQLPHGRAILYNNYVLLGDEEALW
jgi:hypothetical protein